MKKATFIDFDDSFTYNVIQELTETGFQVDVLNWKDFESLPETDLLVLGPGPGHPDDYQRIFPLIEKWMKLKRPLFALCLGHQIVWRLKGEMVVRSKEPLHGQRVTLTLNDHWKNWLMVEDNLEVQRYNSLCVPAVSVTHNLDFECLICEDEIMISKSKNIITYQFHPESVGTTYRRPFFQVLLRHLV